jgi:hypothetical protein
MNLKIQVVLVKMVAIAKEMNNAVKSIHVVKVMIVYVQKKNKMEKTIEIN